MSISTLFPLTPAVIGMIHLKPLPGSPDFNGTMSDAVEKALQEADILAAGGVDGIIVENFWDSPFPKEKSDPVTVSGITVCVREIVKAVKVPVGVNILRNDALSALSVAHVTGAAFIRVNVLTHAMVTDQGIIEGCSYDLSRLKKRLSSSVHVFADVMVKHAYPLAAMDIATVAKDTASRGGADVLIVSGTGTGAPIAIEDARRIKEAVPEVPLASGSGVEPGNIIDLSEYIDLFIVGTYFKKDGKVENPIDPERVSSLVEMVRRGRRK